MDRYWACKKRLFTDYLKPADGKHPVRAVSNSGRCQRRRNCCRLFGSRGPVHLIENGDIFPTIQGRTDPGFAGALRHPLGLSFRFPARWTIFNLENILSAVGAAIALGIDLKAIASGIMRHPAFRDVWSALKERVGEPFSWIMPIPPTRWKTPFPHCGL
jgi:hypothetical protein